RNRAVRVIAHRQAAVCHLGSDTGDGVKRWNASAPGAHALGQSALRGELHGELTSEVPTCIFLIESNIGANGIRNAAIFQQQAQTEAIRAQVIGHDGEAIRALSTQRLNEHGGDSYEPETTRSEEHTSELQSRFDL